MSILGQRKKGLPRKYRRGQRSRGVLGCGLSAKVDGTMQAVDGAGDEEEERMEEDMIQERPNDQQ